MKIGSTMQVVGVGALVVAALTHVAERLDVLPWMGWGQPHSAGHYVDLFSVISGIALLVVGSLFHIVSVLWPQRWK